MRCLYFFKNGNQCKNKTIGDIDRCHIMAHQTDIIQYRETIENVKKEFISSTININNFSVCDVQNDGACAYHCMIFAIYTHSKHTQIIINHESDYVDELSELIKETKNIATLKENCDSMASLMQQILREWIMDNQNREINGMTLKEYISICHEIDDMMEYNELYKKYAGDGDTIPVKTDRINKNGKNIIKKVTIRDRWGGSPEFYAFTQIFGFEVNIYVLKKFSEKNCKILNGSLKNDTSRLKLLETFNKNNGIPTNILLINDRHYCYLRFL